MRSREQSKSSSGRRKVTRRYKKDLPRRSVQRAPDPETNETCCAHYDLVQPLHRKIKKYQTRLLILLPRNHSSALHAEMTEAILTCVSGAFIERQGQSEELVEYTAISYTWGKRDDPTFPLLVCGREVQIKKNLYDFLQTYRHETEQRILWIDALCINQDDEVEKAMQVSYMLKMYENAKNVIVWLGMDLEQTERAVDFMSKTVTWSVSGPLVDWSRNTANDVLLGAENLYARHWILRIWVIQEIWAAKEITVWCGRSSLSWTTYMGGARHSFDDNHDGHATPSPDPRRWPRIEPKFQQALQNLWDSSQAQTRKAIDSNEKSTLWGLLLRTTQSAFTLPQDRIYALLGMARGTDFFIDYESPKAIVFARYTKHLMTTCGVLPILALDATFGGNIDDHELPSWSPNWTTITPTEYLYSQWGDTGLEACRFLQMFSKLDSESESFELLTLQGCHLATIDNDASSSYPHYNVCWNGDEFERQIDAKSSERQMRSRLLATVPIKLISPEMEPDSIDYAASLNAKTGDILVAVRESYLLLILRKVLTPDGGNDVKFTFVGCALPLPRYVQSGTKRRRVLKSPLMDKFQHLRAQDDKTRFTIV